MPPRPPAATRRRPSPSLAPPATEAPLAWSAAVGLAALVAYLWLAPGVSGDKDASELTLVLATGGLAHPTGYPLYTLLGHAFVTALHTLGVGWSRAANAWSAIGGAVAIGFLHALAARLTLANAALSRRARFGLGLLPVGLLALNPVWTVETTLAEVTSWHVAWVCAAAWHFAGTPRVLASGDAARLSRRAVGWGLLCGAGLAHHATAALVVAPLSVALVLAWRRHAKAPLSPAVLRAGGAALVPLASDAWVAWRAFHPGQVQWPYLAPSLGGAFAHLTGAQYRLYLGRFAPSQIQAGFLRDYVHPFVWPSLLLLLLLVWRAPDRDARLTRGALCVAALLNAGYALFYGVRDPVAYLLPSMALGLAALAPAIADGLAAAARWPARVATAAAVLLALALAPGWLRVGIQRRDGYVAFEDLLRRMWAAIPGERGIVFWGDDMYWRLREYQLLRGEKPGLDVVHPILLTADLPRARFVVRHGIDPLEGLAVPDPTVPRSPEEGDAVYDRFYAELAEGVNRRLAVPVIVFDPRTPTVRMLKKAPR